MTALDWLTVTGGRLLALRRRLCALPASPTGLDHFTEVLTDPADAFSALVERILERDSGLATGSEGGSGDGRKGWHGAGDGPMSAPTGQPFAAPAPPGAVTDPAVPPAARGADAAPQEADAGAVPRPTGVAASVRLGDEPALPAAPDRRQGPLPGRRPAPGRPPPRPSDDAAASAAFPLAPRLNTPATPLDEGLNEIGLDGIGPRGTPTADPPAPSSPPAVPATGNGRRQPESISGAGHDGGGPPAAPTLPGGARLAQDVTELAAALRTNLAPTARSPRTAPVVPPTPGTEPTRSGTAPAEPVTAQAWPGTLPSRGPALSGDGAPNDVGEPQPASDTAEATDGDGWDVGWLMERLVTALEDEYLRTYGTSGR